MASASPGSSGYKAGPHLRQDNFPLQGALTHSCAHSEKGKLDTPIHIMFPSLGCGSPQRKPTETWGECVNFTQWPQLGIDCFFSPMLRQKNIEKTMLFYDLLYCNWKQLHSKLRQFSLLLTFVSFLKIKSALGKDIFSLAQG